MPGIAPDIQIPGYHFRGLQAADAAALQRLFEKCADYTWLVDGEAVSPTAAEETFRAGPPGRSLKDKFLFGLFDAQGELAAVLEGFQHYPDEPTWWLGLLLLAPEVRQQGLGRRLVEGFARYVRQQGGEAIMLGVVEDNRPAYEFWQRVGFTFQSQTEPRTFGKKRQAVYILRRELSA